MITQIYSIHDVSEAKMCLEAHVDHIGVALSNGYSCPREASLEGIKEIFSYIGDKAKRVLIVVSKGEEEVLEAAKELRPDIVHICGNFYEATPHLKAHLREISPSIELMQAIGLPSPDFMEKAAHFASFCDYLILDSINPSLTSIGVAGVSHDWNDDKKVIDSFPSLKVIIAGGLGPDNVALAIKKTHPFGVDSFTKTSKRDERGELVKDASLIKRFVEEAKKE
jgi:phosphoribosylanthranilate isomerase